MPSLREPIGALAFAPDDRSIAIGTFAPRKPGRVQIWSLEENRFDRIFSGHEDEVRAISFARGGRSLVSGSVDRTVRSWDIQDGAEAHLLRYSQAIDSLAVGVDGEVLAVLDEDGERVDLWNIEMGRRERSIELRSQRPRSVAFGEGGRLLVIGDQDGAVRLWKAPR